MQQQGTHTIELLLEDLPRSRYRCWHFAVIIHWVGHCDPVSHCHAYSHFHLKQLKPPPQGLTNLPKVAELGNGEAGMWMETFGHGSLAHINKDLKTAAHISQAGIALFASAENEQFGKGDLIVLN